MSTIIYSQVMEKIRGSESVAIETVFAGEEGRLKEDLHRTLKPVEVTLDRKNVSHAKVGYRTEEGRTIVTEPVFPQERLIILGGGHIALQLCEMAVKCDFRPFVCDDRPAFANRDRFSTAEEVLCDTFENCIKTLKITPYDFVVIITRGHVHDGECLRLILSGPEPAYTGMIGSRRRVGEQLKQLEQKGYSRERMNRIRTPIGLNIGGVTPAEIAVSILAELISYRRMPEHTASRPCRDSDLTLDLIEYLATDDSPKAIVTVIETRGSTPRSAGAKMAVSPKGEIVGTIGGGCGEGAIIQDAIDMIGTGRYRVCSIDMTGDVAEKEGMACGGTMKVLIEDGSDTTIRYYDQNADRFIENTLNADMSEVCGRFLAHLPHGGYILDFGCGSGRDAKLFLDRGYRVDATDGSKELCRRASEHAGIPVRQMLFRELDAVDMYDGIWACSSILHLAKPELPDVLKKIAAALKSGGVLYTSFKWGTFEGVRKGRYFTDFTEETLRELWKEVPELPITELWITSDVRPGRDDERWINLLAMRI